MKKQLLGDIYERTDKPEVGNKYHLAWANHKCVWRLKFICEDGINCWLETPKTRKKFLAKIKDLRLLSPVAMGYKPN